MTVWRWTVDVGRPFDADLDDEEFDDIAGGCSESGGSGFGMRDLQYGFGSRKRAQEVEAAFEHLMAPYLGVPEPQVGPLDSNIYVVEPYVSIYWDPDSILLTLVRDLIRSRGWKGFEYNLKELYLYLRNPKGD